jgi:hypothetical protein
VVTITEASRAKSILAFSFNRLDPPAIGQIDGTNITLRLRVGTPVTALVATFTLSSLSHAYVGLIEQVSGTTPNDFTHPVIYKVTAEDGSSLDYTVTVEFNTGIEENDWLNQIKAYPNPVADHLTIEAARPLDRVIIINGLGQTIGDIRNNGQSTLEIPTESWMKGMYFVKFYSEDKFVGTRKIIKD